jgi:hypothetical protein
MANPSRFENYFTGNHPVKSFEVRLILLKGGKEDE